TVMYSEYRASEYLEQGREAGRVTVGAGVVPDSNGLQFNSAGTFYWQAVYSGDANNTGATSTCTDEKLVIAPNGPSIATTLSESKVGRASWREGVLESRVGASCSAEKRR